MGVGRGNKGYSCLKCEIERGNPRKKGTCNKATHTVIQNGIEIPLCDLHYEEYLLVEDFIIDLVEEDYGDYDTED
jgi:hypothetical protein